MVDEGRIKNMTYRVVGRIDHRGRQELGHQVSRRRQQGADRLDRAGFPVPARMLREGGRDALDLTIKALN